MDGLRLLWPWPAKHFAGAHTHILPHALIIPPYRIPNRMGLTCNLAGTDILSDLSLHFGLTPWFFLEITLFPFRKEPAAKYFLDYWIFPLCLGGWSVTSLRCSSCCRPVPSRQGKELISSPCRPLSKIHLPNHDREGTWRVQLPDCHTTSQSPVLASISWLFHSPNKYSMPQKPLVISAKPVAYFTCRVLSTAEVNDRMSWLRPFTYAKGIWIFCHFLSVYFLPPYTQYRIPISCML